jgi:hypothetical protein
MTDDADSRRYTGDKERSELRNQEDRIPVIVDRTMRLRDGMEEMGWLVL